MSNTDIEFKSHIDLNKNEIKNATFHKVTSENRPASPTDGQIIFETDTKNVMKYNAATSKWEPLGGSGSRRIKGKVGGTGQGALANLPTTDVSIGDEYIVEADGDYGPTGATQHATKGDSFIAMTESGTNPVEWLLIDSNERLSGTFTIEASTRTYTIANTIGSTDLNVTIYDNNGKQVFAEVTVTASNITINISSNVATAEAGNTYKVVAHY